jgi:protein-S-isoprenylcysteine O-methyltransferase
MSQAGSTYLFDAQPVWAFVFYASFLAFFVVGSWVHQRDRVAQAGEERDRGSRAAIYIGSLLGIACAFLAPFAVPQARIGLPPEYAFVSSMIVFWLGLLLYVWSVLTLGAHFRTTVQLLDGHRLVRRGPYRLLRHPAYAGGILLFAGIGLACGNWVSAAGAALAVAIAYARRIHVEEIALREKFGAEFDAHRRRTWAVIPLIW